MRGKNDSEIGVKQKRVNCDVMNIDREVWLGVLGEGTFTQGLFVLRGKIYVFVGCRKIRRRMRMENGWKWDRIPKINLIVL